MSSTALAIHDAAPVVTADQQALIVRTVAVGATPDELKLYFYDCARQGVHPLDKLIHFTKRGGKYTPVTSIDFLRIRAAETEQYAGNDDARFTYGAGGHETPDAASVTVYRLVDGEPRAFSATARWREYVPDPGPNGRADVMWRKMPHTMLAKCAEALALRKGFPRQLAGLYTHEELDQAGDEREEPMPAPSDAPSTPAEPVPPVHVPEGAVTITKVDEPWIGQKGNAKGFVFHSAMPSGAEGLPVYSSSLKTIADECRHTRAPVILEIAKSGSSGRAYLKGITKYEASGDPLTAADIPFSS